MKLNVTAFGLACGIIWGVMLFLVTWWIIAFDGATGDLAFIGRIYRGYNISPAGSVMGLIWGALDGFVGGVIFAWLYNFIAARFSPETAVAGNPGQAVSAVE